MPKPQKKNNLLRCHRSAPRKRQLSLEMTTNHVRCRRFNNFTLRTAPAKVLDDSRFTGL